MSLTLQYTMPAWINDQAIGQQLERIFLHPDFCSSEILRKFLAFVVQETLIGNANCLKEYTIAIKVLQKPVNFNPQKNCIVRIHAGRLRRALFHYYNEPGSEDEIIIGIPKGKYVPVFMDRQQWLDETIMRKPAQDLYKMRPESEQLSFAILPFNYNMNNDVTIAFMDNLCLLISSRLSQVKHLSVVSYQVIKSMAANYTDLKELSVTLRFNHIISVGVQYFKNRSRINIQITDCRYYRQIWSRIFDYCITDANLFEVQDVICQAITSEANNLMAID
jgi:TolB-like protein